MNDAVTRVLAHVRSIRACTAACTAGLVLGVVALSPPTIAQTPAGATVGGATPELPAEPLPEPIEDAAFPIPPVPERPFGVEEGDRIFVESFEIRGANARPKHGVALEELRDLVEKIRVEGQGLGEVGEDGFTEDERKEVLSFFKRVVELREFDDYLYDDYSDLVTQLREERLVRRAGLTIGQLQEVADQDTKYYKDKGFVLAQAFIPAQEVEDGKVVIEVVEGRLGRVIAQGNEGYPSDLLAAPFEDLVDSPVSNAAIESAILTLRDYPGLTPTAVFRPGARVGTADLVLSVQREKPYDVSINIDNNGSKFTGERRITVDARWNNPTGAGDVLAAQVLQAWKPKNSVFYSVTYERPIWPGAIAHGEVSRQDFAIGADQAALNITGVLTQLNIGLRQDIFRSRLRNIRADLSLKRTNSVLKFNKTVRNKENLAFLEGELSGDNIDVEHNGIDVASVGFAYGLHAHFGGDIDTDVAGSPHPPPRRGNAGRFSNNNFMLVRGQYTRLQNISPELDVLMRVEGQWSNSLLSSQNQYKLGGPNNVRAYPVSEYLRDTAAFASMEWFWKAPFFADAEAFSNLKWGDVFKVSFFADYAVGTVNQPQAGDLQNVDISGYGAAAHFEIPGELIARLQASHPLSGLPPSNNRGTQWWFDLNYRF